jgi:ferredoxin-NADP reductase
LSTLRRRRPVRATARDLELTVDRMTVEAEDVVSLRLVRPARSSPVPDRGAYRYAEQSGSSAELPAWSPGAHLDLVLPSGRVRQYSLCGDPADRNGYRIAVRRLPGGGGGSVEVHSLRPAERVRIRGPRQAFPLLSAPRMLFVAGGIGITPILPMVRAAAVAGLDWRLVYAGRDRASMPFLEELAGLGHEDRVVIRADAEHGGPATGPEILKHAPGAGSVGYCCGPPAMLAAVRAAAAEPGSPLEVLHAERFAAPPVLGGRPLTVELARAGVTLDVPGDRSVLDVVRERLPDVAYSCRQGFCGTCRVRVLDGMPEHRDRALTSDERVGAMAICVSRAATDRLVLDL